MQIQNDKTSGESLNILSKASLFEEGFSIDWLLDLSDLRASEILSILDQKKKTGDLEERQSGMFCFTDENYRLKLFNSVSKTQRRDLHEKAVLILIKEATKNGNKAYILSKHLLHITNDVEGCRWLIKAGDLYADEVKYQDAVKCYTKAITDLSSSNEKSTDRLFVETVYKYMNMFSVRSESEWTNSILINALSRAEAINDKAFLSIINLHLAINQWQRSNYRESEKYFSTGWSIGQEVGDTDFLKSIHTISAYFYYLQGRFAKAIAVYEKSFHGVEQFPKSMSLLYAVAAMGRSYAAIGQASQGVGMLDAIRKHCLEINQNEIADWALIQVGYILKGVGRIDDVHQLLKKIKEENINSSDVRFKEDLLLLRALVNYWRGNKEKSVEHLKNYLQIIKENEALGMPIASYGFVLKLCWSMEKGEYPSFEDLSVEKAVNHSISSENVFYKGYGYRYKALLQKKNGESPENILKSLNLSLHFLEESGHRLPIARTRIEIARFYLSFGDEQKAREEANKSATAVLLNRELQFPDDLRFLIKDISVKGNLLDEILQLSHDIGTIRNTSDIEKHILLTVIKITGAERGAIFLRKKGTSSDEFTLRAAKNITVEHINSAEFKPTMAIVREVAASRKGIINKLDKKPGNNNDALNNIRSNICVPMIIKDEVLGVLYFDNRFLASAFKETDLKMFTYFASQVAIALDNAEAYDEVKRLNLKLNNEKQYYKDQHLKKISFTNMIGETPLIKSLKNKISKVTDTNTTVLILGETGVGKELVAGNIMDQSLRSDKPYIRVNCSAFSEGLIASELFGHEKGAFTGADKQKAGRFELADGGTLFLDEIGDIPMEVQVRLLRVLQSQEFERVGGTKTLHSDFRLIAATNQNLQKLVKIGKFREDLYYRINVFPITVPPLRKRKGDIPLLALNFVKQFSRKMGKELTIIPEQEMNKLLEYDWPGNVRELENVIERSVIMASDNEFKVPELSPSQPDSTERVPMTLVENERQHILWAMEKTGWKISGPGGAAELLDINYGTLRSRMKKLDIKKTTTIAT